MVLLKNDRRALPLSARPPRSIAVIGPSGDDAMYITGGSAGGAAGARAGRSRRWPGIARARGRGVQVDRGAGLARRRAAARPSCRAPC